jgi:C-terminal processing protease CtpA/Prc
MKVLLALLLFGQVNYPTIWGYIGILYNPSAHTVVKVYPNTPADGVLQKKDKIVEVDGDPKGEIDGEVGTYVYLTIKRGNETFKVKLLRVERKSF